MIAYLRGIHVSPEQLTMLVGLLSILFSGAIQLWKDRIAPNGGRIVQTLAHIGGAFLAALAWIATNQTDILLLLGIMAGGGIFPVGWYAFVKEYLPWLLRFTQAIGGAKAPLPTPANPGATPPNSGGSPPMGGPLSRPGGPA